MVNDETKGGDPKVQLEATKFAIQQFAKQVIEKTGVDPHTLIDQPDSGEGFQVRQIDEESFDELSDLQQSLVLLVYELEESMREEEYLEKNKSKSDFESWHDLRFTQREKEGDDYSVDSKMGYRSGARMGGWKKGGIKIPHLTAEEVRLIESMIGFEPTDSQKVNQIDESKLNLFPGSDELSFYETNIPILFAGYKNWEGTVYRPGVDLVLLVNRRIDYEGHIREVSKVEPVTGTETAL